MDYLDPLARRKHLMRLYTGYVLVAIAIMLAAFILLMIAYGFGLGKNGEVIQSGLLFTSSQPKGADIYIDGVKNSKKTNARFNLPEATYSVQLKRAGYRTWQRTIAVHGGRVIRYDYPFLFPATLQTSTVKTYPNTAGASTLATVSPDNRWLVVQPTPTAASFELYDLKATPLKPVTLTLPASLYTAGGHQAWQSVSWADDKTHVLLKHSYGKTGTFEYILLDRSDITKSVNLSRTFGVTPTTLKFIDSKYDQYYLYNATEHTLQRATLKNPVPVAVADDVLTYDSYQDDTVLYVTPSPSDKKLVEVRLLQGDETHVIKQLPAGTTYQVAITSYSGDLYLAAAAHSQNVVYIYKNPVAQLDNADLGVAVPAATLRIKAPNFLSFSVGGRIVVAENGTTFATYDNEYKSIYHYTTSKPLDAGQIHATWMDGARLQYVSKGQLYVFDFDGRNPQLLMPALRNDLVFYDSGFKHAYTLTPPKDGKAGALALTSTWLLTPADQ